MKHCAYVRTKNSKQTRFKEYKKANDIAIITQKHTNVKKNQIEQNLLNSFRHTDLKTPSFIDLDINTS